MNFFLYKKITSEGMHCPSFFFNNYFSPFVQRNIVDHTCICVQSCLHRHLNASAWCIILWHFRLYKKMDMVLEGILVS